MGWAIRDQRYRYVEWRRVAPDGKDYRHTGEVAGRELYDYECDSHETRNLAGSSTHREVLADQVRLFDRTLAHLPEREP